MVVTGTVNSTVQVVTRRTWQPGSNKLSDLPKRLFLLSSLALFMFCSRLREWSKTQRVKSRTKSNQTILSSQIGVVDKKKKLRKAVWRVPCPLQLIGSIPIIILGENDSKTGSCKEKWGHDWILGNDEKATIKNSHNVSLRNVNERWIIYFQLFYH